MVFLNQLTESELTDIILTEFQNNGDEIDDEIIKAIEELPHKDKIIVVKEILESNMQDLKDHLAKQGMMIQDLSVSVGDQNKEPVFEQKNYKSFRRKQNALEVENSIYAGGSTYGMEVREPSYYWPDSTVSFSA